MSKVVLKRRLMQELVQLSLTPGGRALVCGDEFRCSCQKIPPKLGLMNANRPFEVVGEDGNQIDTFHSDWVPFLPARVAERALEQTRMYLHRAVGHQPAKVVSQLAEVERHSHWLSGAF